jgi:acyl carrier protein
MELPEIEARVRAVVVRALSLQVAPAQLPAERPLTELFGFDSIAVLEYVLALEAEFGLRIESEQLNLELLSSIPRLSRYLFERVAASAQEPGRGSS